MGLKIFNVILWSAIGIIALTSENITKFDYAIMWIALVILLIARCLGI